MTKSSSSPPVLCWATQGKTEHMATIVDPTVLAMLKKDGAAAAAASESGGGGGSLSTLPQDSKIKIKWESTLQKESVLVSSIRLASDEQAGGTGTRRRTSSRRTTTPVSSPSPSKQRQKKEMEEIQEEEEAENEEVTATTSSDHIMMTTIAINKNSKNKDNDNDSNIVKETEHDEGPRAMLAVVEEDEDHQNDDVKTIIAISTKPKPKKAVISSSSPAKPSALPSSKSTSSSSSSSLLLLPPPYSYDNLYSSYQNEWDHAADNNTIFDDNDVSDLKWVVVTDDNDDDAHNNSDNAGTAYLLACTSSGEIVSYRMIKNNDNNNNNDTSALLLKPHGRLKICSSMVVDDNDNDDDNGGNSDEALYKMQIVSINATDEGDNDNTKNNDNSRKRRRNHDNDDDKQKQQLLIIAGERGLWSIPLSDLLKSSTTNDNCGASLLQLSDRPIAQLQIPPPPEENDENKNGSGNDDQLFLMALEKDTNIVSKWNLQTIIKRHNNGKKNKEGITATMDSSNDNNSNSCLMAADKQFDLSRYFSANLSKSNKRRYYRNNSGKSHTKSTSERATTILLVKSSPSLSVDDEGESSSPPSTSCSLSLLVGTDRSRLMILPLKNNDEDDVSVEHRFLSLEDDSSQQKMMTATTTTKPIWKVTDIIATHGGTWWTVSGVSNSNTGLLVTWHAPTGMATARRQTREAIFKIATTENTSMTDCSSSSLLMYSVSNEAAVTMWNSSFQLERTGKFWVNSPSSKAVTVLQNENKDHHNNNNYVAVGGVGNRIDLFLDHCRVQTVRI
jgi:hypothetical protein